MDTLLNRVNEATHWNNHLPLLYLALEETGTGFVVEMGMGEGSTQWLHDYTEKHNRALFSYDSEQSYVDKYSHLANDLHWMRVASDWNQTAIDGVSVVLIDHAPGERRYQDAIRYKDLKGILVLHDTEEPPCGGNYEWHKAYPEFKYFARIKGASLDGIHNGVWATAVSNHYDLSHWVGKTFGQYTIEP